MGTDDKKVWIDVVKAGDLDAHMAEVGQAQANSRLVRRMLKDFPLKTGSKLLVHGCGTGQMFDYMAPDEFSPYKITFADINGQFLDCLAGRLKKAGRLSYDTVKDDIEESRLTGNYDGILAVLLLEHVEWRRAVDCMLKFKPKKLYIIIQNQPEGSEILDKKRVLKPSIAEFSKLSGMKLIPKSELAGFLEKRGFRLAKEYVEEVPDAKKMVGLIFDGNEA